MGNVRSVPPSIRFGVFEIDLHAGELRRRGVKVKLQEQPLQVLLMLLERPGEVVKRQELQERLWPGDTFVDFDRGLNRAMNRVRSALADDADRPRFIETLARRGYRFIAPVETAGADLHAYPPESAPPGAHSRIESLAVLPLQNLSTDLEQEYFADGMTDELITQVAKIGSLRVISRTSIMQYKGTNKPLPVIAKELGADAVVLGTVFRSGQQVRITAQLIRARDDRHLWSEKYERDLGDILTLQGEVAQAIADQVQVKLTPQEYRRLARARPVSPNAYEAYLKGIFFLNKATEAGLYKSIEFFTQTIEFDPSSAQGYAGLSQSFVYLGIFGLSPSAEVYAKARDAARKALELDETLAEAHNTLADVKKGYDWDWAGAETEYKRALELNPSYSLAHAWYAEFLSKMGRHDEALAEATRARALDPISANGNTVLGMVLYRAGRYDEAIGICRKALELDPHHPNALWFQALALQQKREFSEAVAILENAVSLSDGPLYRALLGNAYALAGERAEALKVLDDLKVLSKQRYVSPLDIAVVYAGLADRDSAFEWLEKAYRERTMRIQELPEPIFSSLHSDPRFHDLMRRIGLRT